jgi:predicted RNase H-like HicB family nuclease
MKRDETISTVHAQYLCTFRPEKGGGYTVRCAAFPEVVTNGRTLDEVRHNAREALEHAFTEVHRAPIISAAARNNVPAIYSTSDFVKEGGLLSYGIDRVDIFRRAASYADRILRGAKPADLPVQVPAIFEMVVNLKTAKALGLMVPQSILLTADEVIE